MDVIEYIKAVKKNYDDSPVYNTTKYLNPETNDDSPVDRDYGVGYRPRSIPDNFVPVMPQAPGLQDPATSVKELATGGRIGFASGTPFAITDSNLAKIHTLIQNTDLSLKEIGKKIGFGTDKKPMDSTSKVFRKYVKKYGEPDKIRLQTRGVKLTKDSPYVKNVIKLRKELGRTQAVAQKLGKENKTIRNVLSQFAPEYIQPENIKGPKTGAKELKKRREKIIKELRQYWKNKKGGELILKQMDKKLADIKAENKAILNMSDDAIFKNKKFQDAMRLNVKALKLGEGLKFDRYEDLSKKEFVEKVKDLARKGEFVQPEHLISLKNKDPRSLLAKNIFPAYGKVGGQMEVLKNFSEKNVMGKRPKEIFNFLKGQNIPMEKPGLWKATKKYALKPIGKAASKIGAGFGPTGLLLMGAGTGGYDLTSPSGRATLAAEAAFAPDFVRGTIGATKGMKNRALQKGVQRALNLGLSVPQALRFARIASPLGIAALGGEALYGYGKFAKGEIERIKNMTPEEKEDYISEQEESMAVSAKDGGLMNLTRTTPPERGPQYRGLDYLRKHGRGY